jgi:hypothetical protein
VETPPPISSGSQSASTPEDHYIALIRDEIKADTTYFSRQMFRYRCGRSTAIIAAALVPVLATVAAVPRWALGALGAIAAISEGVQSLFQYRRSALNAMKKCNELERVLNKYMTATGRYQSPDTAFRHLAEDVEAIRQAADNAFLQTWQTTPSQPAPEREGHASDHSEIAGA